MKLSLTQITQTSSSFAKEGRRGIFVLARHSNPPSPPFCKVGGTSLLPDLVLMNYLGLTLFLACTLSTTALAGTVAAVPSPKLDALTRGRTTTAAPAIAAAPAAHKSPARAAPATSAPAAAPATIAAPAVIPASTIASADPKFSRMYLGAQLGDSIVGGLVGLQISKMYSVEARYDYVDTIYLPNENTKSSNLGISGVALFPLKLSDMEPFYVFAKAGYERSTVKKTNSDPGTPPFIPASTTVTTTVRQRLLIGGGAQYDFSKKFSGRVGVNFIGSDNSLYLAVIYKL